MVEIAIVILLVGLITVIGFLIAAIERASELSSQLIELLEGEDDELSEASSASLEGKGTLPRRGAVLYEVTNHATSRK